VSGEDVDLMEIATTAEPLRRAELLPDAMTVREVAGYLQICDDTVWNLLRDGKLTELRFGRRVRIPKESVVDLAARGWTKGSRRVKS
jgi:excisionase family DNA binding protein